MLPKGIETFLAVARLKTLKAASEELHLAQSTVSKRIQMLEQEYGVTLFEREKGGKEANLTIEGAKFVGIAERMLDLLHEARRFSEEQEHHALSMGAVSSMFATFMPHLITRLIERVPSMHITTVTLHSAEMYDEVEKRNIDVGFSLMQRAHPNVTATQCFAEPMLLMRPAPKGASASGGAVHLKDLDFTREICFPWTPHYQGRHAHTALSETSRVIVDDPTLLVSLLRDPEQWAFIPLSSARHYAVSGGFRFFRPVPEPPKRVCYMLTHKQPRSKAAEALALLREHLDHVLNKEFGQRRDGISAKEPFGLPALEDIFIP